MRRKPGTLVPLEAAICTAAAALRRRGIDEFHGYELAKQLAELDRHSAQPVYNVGGGMENSVSLRELTQFCQELSGKRIEIGRIAETRDADIPFYVSDCTAVHKATDWKPKRKLSVVLENVWQWLVDHRNQLEPILR